MSHFGSGLLVEERQDRQVVDKGCPVGSIVDQPHGDPPVSS